MMKPYHAEILISNVSLFLVASFQVIPENATNKYVCNAFLHFYYVFLYTGL